MTPRILIASCMLGFTLILAHTLPRSKYTSTHDFDLTMPALPGWSEEDVSNDLDLDQDQYGFIGKVFAHELRSRLGEKMLFLVLDAGNFHNPQVCFKAIGSKVEPLEDLSFSLENRTLKAHALYAGDDEKGYLVIYWISIDKKIVDWPEQKVRQLFSTLANRKKTALMVRLDISTRKENLASARSLAKEFLQALDSTLPRKKTDYLFGTPPTEASQI